MYSQNIDQTDELSKYYFNKGCWSVIIVCVQYEILNSLSIPPTSHLDYVLYISYTDLLQYLVVLQLYYSNMNNILLGDKILKGTVLVQ